MAKAVVVGAGPNGAIAALRLQKLGWSVVLCDRRDRVGGLAAGGSLTDGQAPLGWLPHTAHLAPEAVDGLGLGLSWTDPATVHGVRADGSSFALDEDPGYRAWCAFADGYRAMARERLLQPAPSLRSDGALWPVAKAALGLRRLGPDPMMELLRVAPTSAEDALTEHITDPAVRAVAAGTGLLGGFLGPLSPTGAAILLLDRVLRGRAVKGGPPALAAALDRALSASEVTVRTETAVRHVRFDGHRASGVVLDEGELAADVVVLATDPRTALLELVPPTELPIRLEYQAQEHRCRGLVAVVHLALSEAPAVGGTSVELLHTATHPHQVERAFDAGKRQRLPTAAPVLLRVAPDGKHATAWVHGVPLDPLDVPPDQVDDRVLALVFDAVERVWPGIRESTTAHAVHTPRTLADTFGLAGGHLWHGELALDQLWSLRPGLDLSAHRTAIPGLFLGGGGTHPTGGITGIPGRLAADAVGSPA